jgi:hypothetical protein
LYRFKPEPAIVAPVPLLFGESAREREDATSGSARQAYFFSYLHFGTYGDAAASRI